MVLFGTFIEDQYELQRFDIKYQLRCKAKENNEKKNKEKRSNRMLEWRGLKGIHLFTFPGSIQHPSHYFLTYKMEENRESSRGYSEEWKNPEHSLGLRVTKYTVTVDSPRLEAKHSYLLSLFEPIVTYSKRLSNLEWNKQRQYPRWFLYF